MTTRWVRALFCGVMTWIVAGCYTSVQSVDSQPGQSESKSTAAPAANDHHGVTFYSVDHYDDARDAAVDLTATIQRATAEKKRILIQVGGDWCGWCRRMSEFMETNEMVRSTITDNFILMKVTYTQEQPNEEFLSQYPTINAYPHLFVLESDGKLLHSQETGSLEEGAGYNEKVFNDFLLAWKP